MLGMNLTLLFPEDHNNLDDIIVALRFEVWREFERALFLARLFNVGGAKF